MDTKKINWFGLVGGILVLVVLAVSIYYPWWQLIVGQNLLAVNTSPMNTNIVVIGSSFTVPLIWAANIAGILTFLCSGIIMLVYSVIPLRSYSKDLLGFAWTKPLYAVIGMVVILLIPIIALQSFLGISVPLMGKSTLSIPSNFIPNIGLNASAQVSTAFLWPFWLAITAAVLCIAARIYHKKLTGKPKQATAENATARTAGQESSLLPPQQQSFKANA
jgi:hypothetical protein